jgi:predicted PurR-regulated permease PerM
MLEIPAIGLLALFGALAATVPYFGIVIGWLPVLLLAVGVASGLEVALAALVAASLQVTEGLWWRRQVDDRSIRVGPAVPIVVAILGFGIYGIGGALYGCVLAVLVLAMADQLRPGEAIPTPLDEPPADPER